MKNYLKALRIRHLNKIKHSMSVEEFLKRRFKISLGYNLNLHNPQTYNEKLNWIKVNYHDDLMTVCCDKILVKEYVKNLIGEEYIIPTIQVWDNTDEVNFDNLPDRFVIKCNHNSGKGLIVCKNKNELAIDTCKQKLVEALKEDYFAKFYEWPYKNIKRKILAEQYIESDEKGLIDYKFYCFNGEPKYLLIASDRTIGVKFDYFDINLNPLPFEQGGKRGHYQIKNIKNYDKMVAIARKLSKGFPHVRVDLYNLEGKILFGELTFFDSAGFGRFKPRQWDYEFGKQFALPEKKVNPNDMDVL